MNGPYIDFGQSKPDLKFDKEFSRLRSGEISKSSTYQSNANSKHVKKIITVPELVNLFKKECMQQFVPVGNQFATYFVALMLRDITEGLDLSPSEKRSLSVCKIDKFIEWCVQKYTSVLNPTICSLKMLLCSKKFSELTLEKVNEKYDISYTEKLNYLIRAIVQYPETSNPSQLEEMFIKIQTFIVTCYQLGSPQEAVLLKETRQSLNSVIGKADLHKYVLKKKDNRVSYLKRLSATVCGIIIFNSYRSQLEGNDSGFVRNIFTDLEMAQRNTKEYLDQCLNRATKGLHRGFRILQHIIVINTSEQKVQYLVPISKAREINKFVVLFQLYKRNVEHIIPEFDKTKYKIEDSQKKFKCVVEKIIHTIKFRSAVDAELVFPHFVYLSEVWTSFILYLNHLTEINKVLDKLEGFISEKLEQYYNTIVDESQICITRKKYSHVIDFAEILDPKDYKKMKYPDLSKNHSTGEFCALTQVITKGLLLPSKLKRKLSKGSDILFGYAYTELSNYADRSIRNFAKRFSALAFGCIDLILLYGLDEEVLKQYADMEKSDKIMGISSNTQTEFPVKDSKRSYVLSLSNVSWNIWDHHRQTIHLANLRQKQTHSGQSKISYGQRNAQNQAYNTREQ